jgi:hypothetical protein
MLEWEISTIVRGNYNNVSLLGTDVGFYVIIRVSLGAVCVQPNYGLYTPVGHYEGDALGIARSSGILDVIVRSE